MADGELRQLLQAQGWRERLSALQLIRKKGLNLPEDVLRTGSALLCKSAAQLGDDKWQVLEDVFYAALRCHSSDWVTAAFKALKTQFGSAPKVLRMEASVCEYTGNVQEASAIYESLLKTDPNDQLTWKRKCSLLRTDGKTELCIKSLNSYLEVFQGDVEAWEELADIYMAECQFAKAAFAYEEVLLASPYDFWVVQRYGEIVYSIGGLANLQTARSYFLQALLLSPRCVRAMWALHQCCRQVETLRPDSKADPDNARIKQQAEALIREAYGGRRALEGYQF